MSEIKKINNIIKIPSFNKIPFSNNNSNYSKINTLNNNTVDIETMDFEDTEFNQRFTPASVPAASDHYKDAVTGKIVSKEEAVNIAQADNLLNYDGNKNISNDNSAKVNINNGDLPNNLADYKDGVNDRDTLVPLSNKNTDLNNSSTMENGSLPGMNNGSLPGMNNGSLPGMNNDLLPGMNNSSAAGNDLSSNDLNSAKAKKMVMDSMSIVKEKINNIMNSSSDDSSFNLNMKDIEDIDLSPDNLKKLVGEMTQEEYDIFIKELEKKYEKDIDIYNELLDGKDGVNELLDRVNVFETRRNIEGLVRDDYSGFEMAYQDRILYYLEHDEFFKDKEITIDEYRMMTDDERLDFLAKYDDVFKKRKEEKARFYSEIINPKIKEELSDLGINNYEDYMKFKNELTTEKAQIEEAINMSKNAIASAKYDYIYYLKDFEEYEYNEPSEKDLKELESYKGLSTHLDEEQGRINKISYEDYKRDHPNITPIEFLKMLNESNLNGGYTVDDIDNLEELKNLISISDVAPQFSKVYSYLYEQDPEKAEQYLKDCKYEINNVLGQIEAKKVLDKLDPKDGKYDDLGAVANALDISEQGLEDGLIKFAEGGCYTFEALLTALGVCEENRVKSVQEYKRMYILQALLSNVTQEKAGLIKKDKNGNYVNTDENSIIDYTKEYSGPFLDSIYEISQSIGNMLPSIALTSFCPMAGFSAAEAQAAGLVAMGVSAGGNSYHEAMLNGNDLWRAIGYGILSGGSEALSEKFLGGLPGISDAEVDSLRTWLKAAVSEGSEEVYQNFIDTAWKAMVLGEKIEIPNSQDEWEEFFKEQAKTFTYSFITAGILQSPRLVKIMRGSTTNVENEKSINDIVDESNKMIDEINKKDIANYKKYHEETTENGIFMPTLDTFNKKIDIATELWPQLSIDPKTGKTKVEYLLGKGVGAELAIRGEVKGRKRKNIDFPYRSHSDFEIYDCKGRYDENPNSAPFIEVFGAQEVYPDTYTKGLKGIPEGYMDSTYETVTYNGKEYYIPELELLFLDKYLKEESTPRAEGTDAELILKQYELDPVKINKYFDEFYKPSIEKRISEKYTSDFVDKQIDSCNNIVENNFQVESEIEDFLDYNDGVMTADDFNEIINDYIHGVKKYSGSVSIGGLNFDCLPDNLEFVEKDGKYVLTDKSISDIKSKIESEKNNEINRKIDSKREELNKLLSENIDDYEKKYREYGELDTKDIVAEQKKKKIL